MAINYPPEDQFERALAFQNLLVKNCEGYAAFDEPMYRLMRNELMGDPYTADAVPRMVRTCSDLKQFWAFIKDKDGKWDKRRQFVRDEFRRLLEKLEPRFSEGRTSTSEGIETPFSDTQPNQPLPGDGSVVERAAEPNDGLATSSFKWTDVYPPLDGEAKSTHSSDWTGRVTPQDQARLVMSLGPAAFEGVSALLSEQEHRLHNHPPEGIDEEGLQALKDLHEALGVLIRLAEGGREIDEHLSLVRSLSEKVFSFATDTAEICVGGLRPLLASAPVAWGTWFVLGLTCNPATFSALGPAMTASVVAGYLSLGQASRQKKQSGRTAKNKEENGGRGKD